MSDPADAGVVTPENDTYAELIQSELKAERDRKTALDTRGGNLVTSSGAVFAVLVGVGSLGRASGADVPNLVDPLLVLALLAFLASAILGVSTQWNREYEVINVVGLKQLLDDLWREPPGASMRRVSANCLRTIETLRTGNCRKEYRLRWGYGLQILAIVFLGPIAFLMIAAR